MIMVIGMVLLAAGVAYASGVVFFGGNAYESNEDKLVLDLDLSEANYDSGTKTFTDDSSGGNDVISNNAASFIADEYGVSTGAMDFNGVDDWVNISSGLSGISGNITTFSAWIKLRTYDTNGCVLGHTDTVGDEYWQIVSDTQAYMSGNSISISSTNFDDNTWRHVVFVSDGINSIFYVNGVQKGGDTGAVTSLPTGAKNFIIGTSIGNAPNWRCNGSISEVKLWNRSLSSTEVMALYNSSKPKASAGSQHKGLVGHWALDSKGYDSNTNRTTDKTPYENHGTNYGATLTTDRMGHSNKAMSFDGVSARVTIVDQDEWAGPEISMTFWVNTSDVGNQGLFCQDRHNGPCMSMIGSTFLMFSNGSECYRYSGTGYNDGNWHFVVGTVNLSGVPCISVDGGSILCDTPTQCNPLDNSEQPLYIGYGAYGYANASISDVRIYNHVLSVDEINALYNSYRPKASSGSLQKGLILDMPLKLKYTKDETVGSEIMTDRTPYSNDGQNYGATVGSSYSGFDGDDYVRVDNFMQDANQITISHWIKSPYNTGTSMDTFNGTVGKEIWFYPLANDLKLGWNNGGANVVQYTAENMIDNNWHHLVGTYNGSTFILYVDGNEVGFKDDPGYIFSGQMLGIGYQPYGSPYYFNGSISSARIYNRALSESEIKLLYDKGR